MADDEVELLRRAGYTDGKVSDVVANVALRIFTNDFNYVAGKKVDFPPLAPCGVTTFDGTR